MLENNAELNKGVDYAFAKRGPRIGDFHAAASKITCFFTFAVEIDMWLVLGDLSSVRCDIGLPRIAHTQKGTLEKASAPPDHP